MGLSEAPSWTITTFDSDPGVHEYWRPVGTVVLGDSHEELSVALIQRSGDGLSSEIGVSMAGMRLSAAEADLVFRVVKMAVDLIAEHTSPEVAPAG